MGPDRSTEDLGVPQVLPGPGFHLSFAPGNGAPFRGSGCLEGEKTENPGGAPSCSAQPSPAGLREWGEAQGLQPPLEFDLRHAARRPPPPLPQGHGLPSCAAWRTACHPAAAGNRRASCIGTGVGGKERKERQPTAPASVKRPLIGPRDSGGALWPQGGHPGRAKAGLFHSLWLLPAGCSSECPEIWAAGQRKVC